jgi:hypothetical protein
MAMRAVVKGDRVALEEHSDALDDIAVRSRSLSWLAGLAQHRAAVAVIDGRYDDAEDFGAEMLQYGRRLRDPNMVMNYGILMFPLWREQSRAEVLEEPTRRAVERAPEVTAWRSGLAEVLLSVGKLDDAHAELDILAHDDFAVPDDPARRYALCGAAHVAAVLEDRPRSALLYQRLLPEAGLGVILGPIAYHGVADRFLGLLALTLDRPEAAVEHLEAALARVERFGARPWSRPWVHASQ